MTALRLSAPPSELCAIPVRVDWGEMIFLPPSPHSFPPPPLLFLPLLIIIIVVVIIITSAPPQNIIADDSGVISCF